MSPFSCGIKWVNMAELRQSNRESIANEPNERKRLMDAQNEYYDKSKGKDNNSKFMIFKEVAKKYGYNEDYFITKVTI